MWIRLKNSDVWHFCIGCSHIRKRANEYEISKTDPKSGELCNECMSKLKNKKCTELNMFILKFAEAKE